MLLQPLAPAVAAVCLLLPAAGAAQTEWKERTWKAGDCSALLPGEPVEQTKDVGQGRKVYLWIVSQGKIAYVVSYADMPELAKAGGELIEKALENGRKQAAVNLKGKVIYDKEHKLNGNPGREVHIETPALGIYRMRMYVIGPRLYQVIVLGPREVALSKDSDRYLDSFKVTK